MKKREEREVEEDKFSFRQSDMQETHDLSYVCEHSHI